MKINQRNRRKRLVEEIEQASEFRVLLALIVLFALRSYRRLDCLLRSWLLPERRTLNVHWVGERRRSIRPVHLLIPVLLAEFILAFGVIGFVPRHALFYGFVGNLVLAGLVMLPTTFKRTPYF